MQLTLQLNNPRILSSFNSWSRLKILMSCWCGKWSTIILSKLGVSLFISINHFSIPSHYVHLLLLSYLMKRFRSFTLVVRPAKSRMIRQTFRVMVRNEIRSIKKIVFQHSLICTMSLLLALSISRYIFQLVHGEIALSIPAVDLLVSRRKRGNENPID